MTAPLIGLRRSDYNRPFRVYQSTTTNSFGPRVTLIRKLDLERLPELSPKTWLRCATRVIEH
jgi:hypothetical protein